MQQVLTTGTTTVLNWTVWVIAGLFVLAVIVVIVWLWLTNRKYQEFQVTILGKDGFGHPVMTYDTGGVFEDKLTHNLRLFLRKHDVGLSADNVPYINGPKGIKQVFLLETGRKNYRYIKYSLDDLSMFRIQVGEEDVNWAINAYERQKRIFTNAGIMPYLPYILLAFVSLVILIIFIYFFKDFGVLKDMATELHKAVVAMQQLKSGTVVV